MCQRPRKSHPVVAGFVDVAGHAVRDLVQQDGRLDAVPRDPTAQPVRGGDASAGGFRYRHHLRWMGSSRVGPDVIDDGLRLLEGDHAAVPGVNVTILPSIDAGALVVSAHFRLPVGSSDFTPRESGMRSPAAVPLRYAAADYTLCRVRRCRSLISRA